MSGRFVSVDRDTAYLLPPSVQEWLPDNHLARFVVEIVEQLDLSELTQAYRGRGSEALRYVAANQHPDHDTIAEFRQRLRTEIKALFVQILGVARQLGVLKLGK